MAQPQLKNNMVLYLKNKMQLLCNPAMELLGIFSQRKENLCSPQNVLMNVYSNLIYSQKLKAI